MQSQVGFMAWFVHYPVWWCHIFICTCVVCVCVCVCVALCVRAECSQDPCSLWDACGYSSKDRPICHPRNSSLLHTLIVRPSEAPYLWTLQLGHARLNDTRRETSKPDTSILPWCNLICLYQYVDFPRYCSLIYFPRSPHFYFHPIIVSLQILNWQIMKIKLDV